MTTLILKGAPIAARLEAGIDAASALLRARGGAPPVLATLIAGEHPSALAYRRSIEQATRRVGIEHRRRTLQADCTADELVAEITQLNVDASVTGILILMPLPGHLSPELVLENLSPLKDVDGITPTNAGRLHLGLPSLRPSTPQGGIEILDHYGIELAGSCAVVIGRSNVVGRPLATILTSRHATVTLCHRQTRDLAAITRQADLVALAAGHPGLLRGDMIRPGATVLDFGVNVVDGRLVGDADFASVAPIAGAITPVPGGTGPVTTLVLVRNTIAAGFAGLRGDLGEVTLVARVNRT